MNVISLFSFHKDEYDLKGHERSHKARLANFFLAHSFLNQLSKYFVEYEYYEIQSMI